MRTSYSFYKYIQLKDNSYLYYYYATDGRCSVEHYTHYNQNHQFIELFNDTNTFKGKPEKLKKLLDFEK